MRLTNEQTWQRTYQQMAMKAYLLASCREISKTLHCRIQPSLGLLDWLILRQLLLSAWVIPEFYHAHYRCWHFFVLMKIETILSNRRFVWWGQRSRKMIFSSFSLTFNSWFVIPYKMQLALRSGPILSLAVRIG